MQFPLLNKERHQLLSLGYIRQLLERLDCHLATGVYH